MLKLVSALGLLIFVCSEDLEIDGPPGALSAEDKLKKVTLPEIEDKGALQSINPSACLDKKIYHDIDELLTVENEEDYLCAYISFQANKIDGDGIPLYSSREEATKRYTCFKQTVDQVNEVNGQDKSYTLEVNKFADMTPYERSQYLGLGFRTTTPPDSCDEDAKADDKPADDGPVKLGSAPLGFGAAAPGAPPGAPPGGFGVGGAPPRGFGA